MAIVLQRADASDGNATPALTIDIGVAGNDRLIVVYMQDESEPGATFQGTVTVDGKNFTQQRIVETTSQAGAHLESHTIDEDALGSSNGPLEISYSGGSADWTMQVKVYYGVKDDTMISSNTAIVLATADISVTNITSNDDSLISMGVLHGAGNSAFTGITSPLSTAKFFDAGGYHTITYSGIETTGQTNKTYTSNSDSSSTRQVAIAMVFDAAAVIPGTVNQHFYTLRR